MERLGLVQFSTDRAFYAALKMHVYNALYETIFRAVLGGNTAPLDGRLRVEMGRFTARKTNYLFVPDGPRASSSAEFFGFTSHKVREKLTDLSHQKVVDLVGRGLRDAQTYKWTEPIRKWELCSFLRFRSATPDDVSLSLENHRAFQSFADAPFTANEFVEMYGLVHESEFEKSRWGKRKFESMRESYGYDAYLKNRLKVMHKAKLVSFDTTSQRFQLTPAAMEAAQHFMLFSDGPGYVASYDMCYRCPMNRLCNEFGVTDIILEVVKSLGAGANGHHGTESHDDEAHDAITMTDGTSGASGEPLPQ